MSVSAPSTLMSIRRRSGRSPLAAGSSIALLRTRTKRAGGRAGWLVVARWLLLGAVIGGVVAMHILSAADSGGSHSSMAMTSASATSPAAPASASMVMAMDMPAVESPVQTAQPITGTQLGAVVGVGMLPMSCCVLFLVSAVGLVLLVRSYRARTAATAAGARGRAAPSTTQRGPPRLGRPRIALSVLRV